MSGVIDLHAHALPADCFAAVAEKYAAVAPRPERSGGSWTLHWPSGKRSGPFPSAMFDVDARLADMAAQGVDHQVLSAPPFAFFYGEGLEACRDLTRYQNDELIAMAKASRGRFSVLAGLPLVDTDASLAELARIADISEVRGVALGTHVGDEELSADRFEPLWSALESANLGVLLHPDDVVGRDRMRTNFLANLVGNPAETTLAAAHVILGGVLERHPRLRLCLVHGGGFVPYQVSRWDHGWRTRNDVARELPRPPSDYLSQLTFDSIIFNSGALAFLGNAVGWDHVALGTDFPFAMSEPEPVRALDGITLTPEEVAHVLTGSAERFLRPTSPQSSVGN